ncbi:hypothetical protein [Burkholderia cenocepacia]|nr:hypothetical protein [Burkholderia cenocepacia]UXZ92798.1 hypothetical protein NUJ27_23435 [Burkholderia cenocepacia]
MAEWLDMTDRQVELDWLCRDARHDSKVIVGARHAGDHRSKFAR